MYIYTYNYIHAFTVHTYIPDSPEEALGVPWCAHGPARPLYHASCRENAKFQTARGGEPPHGGNEPPIMPPPQDRAYIAYIYKTCKNGGGMKANHPPLAWLTDGPLGPSRASAWAL